MLESLHLVILSDMLFSFCDDLIKGEEHTQSGLVRKLLVLPVKSGLNQRRSSNFQMNMLSFFVHKIMH